MPNLLHKLKGYLGLSYKVKGGNTDTQPITKGNKNIEKKITIQNGEAKRMFEFDESLRRPFQEISEHELLGERRPGEFLVEVHQAEGSTPAIYKAIRLDITAIYEVTDEYNYTQYYKMASHSESYVTDLSTINFGTNGTDDVADARIKRILAEPKYARTKLDYINMIEVDSTGLPLSMNIDKIPAVYFMAKFRKFF